MELNWSTRLLRQVWEENWCVERLNKRAARKRELHTNRTTEKMLESIATLSSLVPVNSLAVSWLLLWPSTGSLELSTLKRKFSVLGCCSCCCCPIGWWWVEACASSNHRLSLTSISLFCVCFSRSYSKPNVNTRTVSVFCNCKHWSNFNQFFL